MLLEVKAERQLCSLEQKGGYLGARFLSSEEQTADAERGLSDKQMENRAGGEEGTVHLMGLDNAPLTL